MKSETIDNLMANWTADGVQKKPNKPFKNRKKQPNDFLGLGLIVAIGAAATAGAILLFSDKDVPARKILSGAMQGLTVIDIKGGNLGIYTDGADDGKTVIVDDGGILVIDEEEGEIHRV